MDAWNALPWVMVESDMIVVFKKYLVRHMDPSVGINEVQIKCRQRRSVWFSIIFGTDIMGRKVYFCVVLFYVLCLI